MIDSFTLAGSLGFDVLDFSSVNGNFATLNLPAGMTWDVANGTLSFGGGSVGLPGDFNGNGTVDAADYVVWHDNLGGGGNSAAIPEPATLSLLLVTALGVLARCRNSRAALVG